MLYSSIVLTKGSLGAGTLFAAIAAICHVIGQALHYVIITKQIYFDKLMIIKDYQ